MENQEREIKFYLHDIEKLAQRLHACGAELVRPRTLEKNFRLDTMEKSLEQSGRMLRLRQDDRARVTYKANAHADGGLIFRTELEFTVDNFLIAQKLFEALGYQVTISYEKYRRVYRMGEVEVMLDELPLGTFVEVEGPNRVLIKGVAQMLGLNWSTGVAISYLGLFDVVRKKLNLTFNDLTFDNFHGIKIAPEDMGISPADNFT